MTAATIPFVGSPDTAPRAARGEWTPSERDQLVFRWVKFEGKSQGWVAQQLEIHQSTVSRMLEKYERWIAHGGPARQGGLNHDERLRVQRWLTYERNEFIINTALRIAAELEKPYETTRSTISRPAANPSRETEVSTVHMTVDHSGVANRFLRLAHRVNMDNLKLIELDPLPDLDPLTEFEPLACSGRLGPDESLLPVVGQTADYQSGDFQTAGVQPEVLPAESPQSSCAAPAPAHDPPQPMHPTHSCTGAESSLNGCGEASCSKNDSAEKQSADACQVVNLPPETCNSWPVPDSAITSTSAGAGDI